MQRSSKMVVPVAVAALAVFGATACESDDDGEPTPSVVDGDVPFDPNVEPGIDTGTDEGGNMGIDPGDAPGGPVGNPTSPND